MTKSEFADDLCLKAEKTEKDYMWWLRTINYSCHSDRDGDCSDVYCPQNRYNEPARSGRSCPFYDWDMTRD